MTREDSAAYIRGNFQPDDRLAVVLINKRAGSVIQRLSTAEVIASSDFQNWLRQQNVARRYDVYISMNALHQDAHGRCKEDIASIRHVYLDFDNNGDAAVQSLLQRKDLPVPSFVLNTSPGKWQVTWIVNGFEKNRAEQLQRGLARQMGADPAATDVSRVLRLPNFLNHKYTPAYLVQAQAYSSAPGLVFSPKDFPQFQEERIPGSASSTSTSRKREPDEISQSERDWAYAKRALARGDPEDRVIAAIADYRRDDKWHPEDYARRTVPKASEALRAEGCQVKHHRNEPTR